MFGRRLSIRSRLLASVMISCVPAAAFAADTTVGSGQTVGQVQFSGADHVTVAAGGAISTANLPSLLFTGDSTGAVVDNAGLIINTGVGPAILSSAGTPHAGAVTINNSGTVQSGAPGPGNSGIGIGFGNATGPITINNSGTISGTTLAIITGSGNDSLNLSTGSAINGAVNLGAGVDTINLSGSSGSKTSGQRLTTAFGGEALNVNSGYWTLAGEVAANTVTVAGGATFEVDDVNTPSGAFIASSTPTLAIVNNGALILNTADTRLDNGADNLHLSGTGSLQLTGGGTMQLGQNVTMTGPTTITNGRIVVTGDNIASPITVAAQGALRIGAAFSAPDVDGYVTLVNGGGATGSVSGNIVNNGLVTFDRSNASTYGGVISGTGAVTKSGAGVLTLTGDNTYTGVTTIESGTLKLGNGGATGSVAGDIVNNGALIVDRNVPFPFYYGAISGTGSLNKVGSGGLVLLGENTYTGLTTIESGLIQVGSGGPGSIVSDVSIASGAHLTFVQNGVSNYVGSTSGAGQVTKFGTGTLVLTGNLAHTGTTRIEAGTLQVGNGGTAGSISGSIANAGALVFNRSDDATFNGSVSGAGTITKLGGNTLTITTGVSSGGGITIAAGTLKIGNGGTTGSLTGRVLNNGVLVIDRSNNYTQSQTISGSGSLVKAGSGRLTIGGTHTYTGGTFVNAGSLMVTGSIVGPTTLAAGTRLDVISGGSMRGINGDGVTIGNSGTIETPGLTTGTFATIALGDAGNTVYNSGVIRSYNGNAIRFGAGADTLELFTGSAITGRVEMGGGTDTVNLAGLNTKSASQTFGDIFGSEVTNVNSGYWTLNKELGTDQVNIAGGATLELDSVGAAPGEGGFISSSAPALTVVNNGALIVNTDDTRLDLEADSLHLSGTGTLQLTGGGAIQLGQNFDLTGPTTITNGTVYVTGDNVASPFTVASGGRLRIGAAYSAPDADGFVTLVMGGGLTGSITGDIVNNGQVIFDRANDSTYSGAISGAGGVGKLGAGTLTLTGSATRVNALEGKLVVAGSVGRVDVQATASLDIAATGTVDSIAGSNTTVNNAGAISLVRPINPTDQTAAVTFAVNGAGSTFTNSGVVRSTTGYAVRFGNGDDVLNLATGSDIQGRVEMRDGLDTVNLAGSLNTKSASQTLGHIFGSETLNVNSGYWTLNKEVEADLVKVASGATLELDSVGAAPGEGGFISGSQLVKTVVNSGAIIQNTDDTRLDDGADNLHIGGSGTVELKGGGALQYGANTTLTGATTVTNGLLVVTGDNIASAINVGAQGTLRVGAAYSAPDADGFVTLVSGGGTTGSVAGNIVNNGAVIFDRANASTYSGSMSGAGTVTKTGGGVLTLSGANTYTAATTVSGGGLVISAPFASSGVSLASGTGVTFTGPNALTYAGVVSGAGRLTKNGTGVATLSGAHTYTGVTTVGEGGLILTGSIASQSVSVSNGATFTFGASADQTYGGVITGAGSLGKTGAGSLTLTGVNTYTGGTTVSGGSLILANTLGSNVTVNPGGTLQIGTGGTVGSLTGSLRADGTVIFNRSDNYTYAGAFSGNGSLIKRGAGLLTLDGVYTFSGTTSIEGGTIKISQLDAGGSLVVGTGSTVDLSGGSQTVGGLAGGAGSTVNIQNATLTINQPSGSTPTVFNGSLTGSGSLVLTGSGVTDLAGTNTYTGPTTVNGGTLKVNGSITSTVTVNNGGTLGGSGTIGGAVTIGSGGSLSPGNSPGVTTIAGPLTLASGASMIVEVDPTATIKNDRVNVTGGSATIAAGAKLDVRPLGAIANYDRVSDYTILTASGGVNGTFGSNVTSTMALLTPSVSYSANEVKLRLIRNDISFASLADTANQAAVAAAAEGTGSSGAAYGALIGQDQAGARAGYDALSGEVYGAAGSLMIDDGRQQRSTLLRHAAAEGTGAWASLYNGEATIDAGSGAAEARNRSSGLTGGGQTSAGGWNLGFALGFGNADIAVADRSSVTKADTLRAGVYGGSSFGAWRLRLGADLAQHDFEAKRGIAFPTVTQTVAAEYDGSTRQVFGELAYATDFAGGSLEPFVEVAGVWATTDAFTETGGTLGLSVAEQDRNVTFATVGARFSGEYDTGGALIRPQFSVAWRRASGDIEGNSTAAFGSSSFTVTGASLAEDTALIDAGVGFDITSRASASVSYSGALSSDAKDHAVRAGLFVRF